MVPIASRFDHAVIAVRDLEKGAERYRALGFEVRAGGRHVGIGSENAIIRFGLDYLELISVYDQGEAVASGPRGQVLADFLEQHEEGLLGYALAIDDVDAAMEHVRAVGLDIPAPRPMQRMRPDGRLLSWRLLIPSGVAWRRPWPFLIGWDVPDATRLEWEPAGSHPNTATGVADVVVAVDELAAARDLYERQVGFGAGEPLERADVGASGARYRLGATSIGVVAPTGPGEARRAVDAFGAGLFEVHVRAADRERFREAAAGAGAEMEDVAGVGLVLPLPGVRLVVV